MNKRLINKYFLINILCLLAIGSCMNPIQQGISLTVATSSGVVEGIVTRNVITWEDIPYALPPLGISDGKLLGPWYHLNLRLHLKRVMAVCRKQVFMQEYKGKE